MGGAELQRTELMKALKSHPVELRCLVGQEEMCRRLAKHAHVRLFGWGAGRTRARGGSGQPVQPMAVEQLA